MRGRMLLLLGFFGDFSAVPASGGINSAGRIFPLGVAFDCAADIGRAGVAADPGLDPAPLLKSAGIFG